MLDGLRIMSKNIFGRFILASFAGLIVVGFGFFGIRDVFTNFRANQLATIGDAEIGAAQYRYEYQNDLQRLQRQAKRAITNDEARQAGLDRQVLARLLTGAALDQAAQKLDLAISDAEIAKTIRADKTFSGPNGAFDQTRLDSLLRDNGYTENSYVNEQRAYALRQEIAAAVSGSFKAPNVLLAAINQYNGETRKADYFILAAADASKTAPPTDDSVRAYYDLRKDGYRTPEFRAVTVLIVSPADVAKTLTISDEAAKKVYDQSGEKYAVAEKRGIDQLTFATPAAAEKARARLDAGESFDALAADKALGSVQADLGVTTKAAMIDPAVADAAFALPQAGVAGPIHGQFGEILARVKSIEPGSATPFDQIKEQIKSELARAQAKGETQKLHDKIEDLRSQGKTLAQAAGELGLQVQTLLTDASGASKAANGERGAPIPALATAPELLKAIFASDVGVDNDSVSRKDGGYSWFEISSIEPSRLPSFDEVKPLVARALRENTAQRELAKKANDLARQLDSGANLAELAAANGATAQKAEGVRRSGGAGLTTAAVTQIFGLPVGAAGVALGEKGARIVFRVTDSQTPPLNLNDPQLKAALPGLEASAADDLIAQYISGLENQLGVRINQAALRAAVGSEH